MGMARELDPSLFPQDASQNEYALARKPSGVGPQSPTQIQPGGALQYPTAELKLMQAQADHLKASVAHFESQMDQLSSQLKAVTRDSELRLSRVSEQMVRLEEGLNRLTRETADRFAQVSARLNERKVTESKTQELIERQNVLVRNFENRLAAVQKLTADQEQALITAHAALEDARAEIARFRRGVFV